MINFGFEIKVLTGSSLKNIDSISKAISNLRHQIVDLKKQSDALNLFSNKRELSSITNSENAKKTSESRITSFLEREEARRETTRLRYLQKTTYEQEKAALKISAIQEKANKMQQYSALRGVGRGGGFNPVGYASGVLASVGLPIAGGLGVYGLGRSVVGTGTFLENTKIEMDALLGNKEVSADMQKKLIDFASKTPMSIQESMKYGRMLIGGGVKNEDVIKTLKMLGDVSYGSGGDLSSVMFNYLQGLNKKNIDTIDIRQYGNQLIPMMRTLEFMFKDTKAFKNMGGIQPMIEAGLIGKSAIDEALKLMTGNNGMYKDFMEEKMKTTWGKWEVMVQKIQISSAKLFDYMKPAIDGIIDSVTNLADRFDELYPSIIKLANPFIMIWNAGKGIAETFGLISDNSNDLTGNLKSLLEVLEKILYVAVAIKGLSLLAGGVKAIAKLGALVSGIELAVGGATLGLASFGTGLAVLVPLAVTAAAAYMMHKAPEKRESIIKELEEAKKDPGRYYEGVSKLTDYVIDPSKSYERYKLPIKKPDYKPFEYVSKKPNIPLWLNGSFSHDNAIVEKDVRGYQVSKDIQKLLEEKYTPKSAEDLINEQLAKLGKELNALKNGGGGVDSGGRFTKIEIHKLVGVENQSISEVGDAVDVSNMVIDKTTEAVLDKLVSIFAIQGNRQ